MNQLYKFKLIASILIFLLFWGCDDIFEKDIQESDVLLIIPKDGFITNTSLVTFSWEYVDGASTYNLIIGKPTLQLDSIEAILLDTILQTNTFTTVLEQGKYQWGISAHNSFTSTQRITRTLYIEPEIPYVMMLTPQDKQPLNDESLDFTWFGDDEDQFIFSLYFENDLIFITVTDSKTISLPTDTGVPSIIDEGLYSWKLQARNEQGTVSPTISRSFLIDRTPPKKPILKLPENDSLYLETPVILTWLRETDEGSPIFDSLFIARDSLFTETIEAVVINNQPTFSFNVSSEGIYHWKVRSYDTAGNIGPFSESFSFKFNEE